MTNYSGIRARIAATALGLSMIPMPAVAAQTVGDDVAMPAFVNLAVETFDCENSPGPFIRFNGAVTLGGMNVQLIFRNQRTDGAPHEYIEDIQIVTAVEADHEIVIPKQPVQGGVGGNPWISVQFVDGDGNALSEEILLGRCVQGAMDVEARLSLASFAEAIVDVIDCTNNPGPFIYVEGSTAFPGVKVRFIFRNQRTDKAPHEASAVVDAEILPSDFSIQFPKQPVQGGVGGNPWISVRFVGPDGAPMGDEHLLGRCVQLHPGNKRVGFLEGAAVTPDGCCLAQNLPNPFNPATTIGYVVPERGWVQLVIYNALGQEVRRLVDGVLHPGSYSVSWDGRNGTGEQLTSGLNVYRLQGEGFRQTRQMMLLR